MLTTIKSFCFTVMNIYFVCLFKFQISWELQQMICGGKGANLVGMPISTMMFFIFTNKDNVLFFHY